MDVTPEKVNFSLMSQQVVVASKANPWNNNTLSAASIRRQLETSLASLQTPCLDIFYLHSPDYTTPLEETLWATNTLHKGGYAPLTMILIAPQLSLQRGDVQGIGDVQLPILESG